METPQPGQVCQHFKGNYYKVILITGDLISSYKCVIPDESSFIKHSETLEQIKLSISLDGRLGIILNNNFNITPHVLYTSLLGNIEIIWARPLDNFMTPDRFNLSINF